MREAPRRGVCTWYSLSALRGEIALPIDRLDFDNLSEMDLEELIVDQVPEGLRIDYKRDLYGNSDADKREVLKDISGFANAFGVGTYEGKKYISSAPFERHVFESLACYINGLRDLGVSPPLIIMITLEGVKDAAYKVHNSIFGDPEPVIERDVVFLPECVINEYSEVAVYHRAVKPAFDALWNTAGCISAQTFSNDGVWTGNAHNH